MAYNPTTAGNNYLSNRVDLGTLSTNTTIDWSRGNVQKCVLGGSITLTMANAKPGQRMILELKQDGTGSRIVTWSTVVWSGGTIPTLTTTLNQTDIIALYYNGVGYIGTASLNFTI